MTRIDDVDFAAGIVRRRRDVQVDPPVARIPLALLDTVGFGNRDFPENFVVALGRDEGDEGGIVGVVGDHREMIFWVEAELVSSRTAAGVDDIDHRAGIEAENFHQAAVGRVCSAVRSMRPVTRPDLMALPRKTAKLIVNRCKVPPISSFGQEGGLK